MKRASRSVVWLLWIAGGLFTMLSIPIHGQRPDPFVGNWVMNRNASSFSPGPAPERRTMRIDATPDGIRTVIQTFRSFSEAQNGGGVQQVEYVAKIDGGDYPIAGSALDTVSLKQVQPNEIQRVGKIRRSQEPVETCTMTLSKNGKVLTMKTSGEIDGTEYKSVQVFDRQ